MTVPVSLFISRSATGPSRRLTAAIYEREQPSDHIFLRFSKGGFQRSQLLLSKRQSRESQDMLATVGLEPIPGYCRKSTWRWVFPWIASRTSRISAWHTSWVDSFT